MPRAYLAGPRAALHAAALHPRRTFGAATHTCHLLLPTHPRPRQHRATFVTSTPQFRATFARHGTAVEPHPSLSEDQTRKASEADVGVEESADVMGAGAVATASLAAAVLTAANPLTATARSVPSGLGTVKASLVDDGKPPSAASSAASLLSERAAQATTKSNPDERSSTSAADETDDIDADADFDTTTTTTTEARSMVPLAARPAGGAHDAKTHAKKSGPMEAVLHLGPPSSSHPHLSPPPYVHHFDSYSLVKQLQDGGFTAAQATTAMKAIRGLLAQNLDVAQESLVRTSEETYLFRAACSELSTELRNNRRVADEQMRQERIIHGHEVDILTQRLNQELLTLTDNVRGMFDGRRMTVREEHKSTESFIQQLTYKISTKLSSDAKSEIEGLRWVLIRRSVLGILFMAVLTLGTLRYATYVSATRKRDAERAAREAEERRRHDGKRDHSAAADAAVILAAS